SLLLKGDGVGGRLRLDATSNEQSDRGRYQGGLLHAVFRGQLSNRPARTANDPQLITKAQQGLRVRQEQTGCFNLINFCREADKKAPLVECQSERGQGRTAVKVSNTASGRAGMFSGQRHS